MCVSMYEMKESRFSSLPKGDDTIGRQRRGKRQLLGVVSGVQVVALHGWISVGTDACQRASERWWRCGRNRLPSFASKMKLMNAEDCNMRIHYESPVRCLAWLSIVFITRGLWRRWFLSCVLHLRRREESRRRRVNALLFKEGEGVAGPCLLPESLPHMFCTLPSLFKQR